MKLRSLEITDHKTGWHFAKVSFGRVNLLVGNSATGKTRFLNTIFNLGRFAVHQMNIVNASWKMHFDIGSDKYRWEVENGDRQPDSDEIIVKHEELWKQTDTEEIPIFQRGIGRQFRFHNQDLPKLSISESGISLLKEEELIAPIHKAFSLIKRRRFFSFDLERASAYGGIPPRLLGTISKKDKAEILNTVFNDELTLSSSLYLLSKHVPASFREISDRFKGVFPFVSDTMMKVMPAGVDAPPNSGVIPVFCTKEKHVNKWIELPELSSGMQKVLLVLTDVLTMPEGAIYMVDEYENSLGINAIDFFPELLTDAALDHQFIITSHHPYLINSIPTKDWFVFHRRGSDVRVQHGEEVEKKFGTSKQKAFTQLINDSFYTEGIE